VLSVWPRRSLFGLVALLLPASLLCAAVPKHKPAAENPSLTGQLLIASPRMSDPRFQRTVILMVRHGKDGALGIAINRPVDERPLASLLEKLGEKDAAVAGSVQIFAGGPVQPEMGFVVHTADYKRPGTFVINGRFSMTQSLEVLRDMGQKRGPQKALVAFGYAGWAPGQLEAELDGEAWFVAPADTQLVFDEARDKVWEQAMARRPRDL
jgi:putative transcriptional regulator